MGKSRHSERRSGYAMVYVTELGGPFGQTGWAIVESAVALNSAKVRTNDFGFHNA
jgi:hypothetical protein